MVSGWGDLAVVKEVAGELWREAVVLPGEAHLVEETIGSHYESVNGAPATREQGVEAFAPKGDVPLAMPLPYWRTGRRWSTPRSPRVFR